MAEVVMGAAHAFTRHRQRRLPGSTTGIRRIHRALFAPRSGL